MSQAGSVDLVLNLKGQPQAVQGVTQLGEVVRTNGQKMDSALASTSSHSQAAAKSLEHIAEAGNGFGQLSEHIELINGRLKSFTNIAHLAGAAVLEIAGLEFIKEQATELAEFGETMERASAKTGLSTEALQEWNFAARVSGTTLDALLPGFRNLTKNAVEAASGHGQLVQVFKNMNLTLKDSSGQVKSTSEISDEFITKLAGIKDKAVQVEIAQKAMGRSATEFLPLLAQGAEGLTKMRDEAHELGIVLGDEAVEKSALLRESMTKLDLVLEATKFKVAIPFIEDATKALTAMIGTVTALEDVWTSTDATTEAADGSLGIFGTVLMGVVDTVEIFALMLRQAQVGYQELTDLMGTAGAAAIETVGYEWNKLTVLIGAVADTAVIAWNALSHPGQAQEAIQGLGKVWEDEQKKIAGLDAEHNRTEKAYWDDFQKGVEGHVADLDKAAAAVDKSLTRIRDALKKPPEAPIKGADTGGDDTDPNAEAEKQKELLALQKETIKLRFEATMKGAQLEMALENDDHTRRLVAYKDSNALLQAEAERHTAKMVVLTQKQTAEDVAAAEKAEKARQESQKNQSKLEEEMEKYKIGNMEDGVDKRLAQAAAANQKELDSFREFADKAKIAVTAKEAVMTEIEKAGAQQRKKISDQDRVDQIRNFSEMASNLIRGADDLFANNRKNALLHKELAMAQIAVNTAVAISNALAMSGPPWVGIAMALTVGAMGLAEEYKASQQKFAEGGFVQGSFTSGDRIPIRANAGEAVLTAAQQREFMALANGGGRGGNSPVNHVQVTYAPSYPANMPITGPKSFTEMARQDRVDFGRFIEKELRPKGYVT